ncbi:MAG: ATP-binding protein [Kineosporiaceae bacterium]
MTQTEAELPAVHYSMDAARDTIPDAPLFYLEGATEGTTQWRAQTLQVVNWGGFEGAVRVPFHQGATLISGASGSGKSTLLDAYIALMMPSDIAFNGASNDAVAGRARSAGQRNLLSYLRGQTDTVPDESGRERPKLLRGEGKATWGAIGMTFVNDHGEHFTALRVYFVPARASVFADLAPRFATIDAPFDLADLAPLAGEQFQPRVLKAAFPGLITHDGYTAFATRLHTKLGIGANGDGLKALRLLARIQAGQQIRTVDDLYKEMVLERPTTYDAADRAIAHFDDLEAAYQAMQTEQDKAELLAPITTKYDRLITARRTIDEIDTFGLTRTAGNPVGLWSRHRERDLLEGAVQQTRAGRRAVTEQLRAAVSAENGLAQDLVAAQTEHRESGGGELASLDQQLLTAGITRDDRLSRRADLAERTEVLDLPLDDADRYALARQAAEEFLAGYDARSSELIAEREALRDRDYPLLTRRRELIAERDSLAGRESRIRGRLHQVRAQVAEAAGMTAEELPFLAELIDLREGEGQWRTAIETVLGASARMLLVPHDRLAAFSRAIDPLHLAGRLVFQGVPLDRDDHAGGGLDPTTVAGKLVFKDSPFTAWVRRHVAEPARNALCVPRADDLAGPGYRVSLAGQTRQGSRGSHGRSEAVNVIGFSSQDVLAEIEEELAGIEAQLVEVDRDRARIDEDRRDLDARRKAFEAVTAVAWAEIDVAAIEAQISRLEQTRDAILASNDVLSALQRRIDQLSEQLDAARQERYRLRQSEDDLNRRWAELVDRQDATHNEIDRLEADVHVVLTPEQSAALDGYFAAAVGPGDPDDLTEFTNNLARLHRTLSVAVTEAESAAATAAADLEAIFNAYLKRFPDPNLGHTTASYPDYAAILERIVATGLHERKEAWRQKLMKWSGEDLVPLSGQMESCVQEIEERLEPINDILRELEFGATGDRLRIKLRRLTPETVADFRRALRELASGATRDLTEDQLQARFVALQAFMARIRRREDPRWDAERSDRDGLLDVRRHVFVTAERYGPDGQVLSTHSALGGKSGGESQELVAFIVGAALRFRLGDELRARPRFAPVFIDEGFIKSDSDFAGRAVRAWKGLGFQLIVGAPPDKVSALEPHMDALLMVTKNNATNYSFVASVTDARDYVLQVSAAEIVSRLGTRE